MRQFVKESGLLQKRDRQEKWEQKEILFEFMLGFRERESPHFGYLMDGDNGRREGGRTKDKKSGIS